MLRSMEREREDQVTELKKLIDSGAYTVDPAAVADAMLRRLGLLGEPQIRRVSEGVLIARELSAGSGEARLGGPFAD
jgi:hypothetical protein